ncbi:DUF1639 family protein [Zea mays]|uniref:DUF1639 family protein n=1 Tax=Zea mays TaxID=4577 RepID=A0A1D6NFS0_MAIZE|nr:DUF1639 family protein [Zea mays]
MAVWLVRAWVWYCMPRVVSRALLYHSRTQKR